ncbi:MAG TPA: glycosyltransferase family 39 protein [Planctomycetota bacterium]|nr:glycosyltransferase family 39 protein [Planctomycetota bacterium]
MPEGEPQPAFLPRRRRWLTVGLVVAVVAAGAGLRFYAIGRKSLWLDEAATMSAVDASFAQVFRGVKAHDAHPPLYYLALHTWMQGSRSAAWARSFSAAVGVATLAVFYFLARALLPRGAALVATLLLAASAYQVYFAQEARHYALAAFFVVAAWYCLAHLVAGTWRHRWPLWLGLALANTAGLYTFYYTAFSVAAQGVVLVLLWRRAGRRLMLDWALWQLVPAAVFGLWVEVILERIGRLSQFEPPAGHTVLSATGLCETAAQFASGFLAELMRNDGPAVRAAAAAVGLLVLALALLGLRRERCATVVAFAWLLGPVAFLAVLPMRGHAYEPKHLIFASPALALAAGVAWSSARGGLRAVTIALLGALLAGNGVSLAQYYRPAVEKENWRGAVEQFAERAHAGDIVTFTPPYVELAYRYYQARHGVPRVWLVATPPAGEPFRGGELRYARRDGRRVWVFQGVSRVEMPNPRVFDALGGYPRVFEWSHEGLVGTVSVSLYDAFQPPAPRGAQGASRRESR